MSAYIYRIEVETEGREVYYVQAATEQEAREIVDEGRIEPSVSEVTGGSITSVERESDGTCR